jgi:putative ferrous iron transport protein C
MRLMDIKRHMMQVRIATLSSLCHLFQTDPDTLRCLLRHWIHKGKMRQCMKTPACRSRCFKCPAAVTEMYEWVEAS